MRLLKPVLALTLALLATPAFAAPSSSNEERQIRCLAENAYHEARGEPQQGKIAVMNVVMNRTKSSKFPDTPCKVVYQGCQFSWVCSGKKTIRNRSSYEELVELARKVYNGGIRDFTYGAKFFHSKSVSPGWGRSRIVTIGNHVFYR